MKCRNCKYLRWAEEYPGMPFFGWCDNVNDSPDMDMERECGCFESATHADIIRRMSDEELLDFMKKSVANAYMCKIMRTEPMFLTLEWLQSPAEEDTRWTLRS